MKKAILYIPNQLLCWIIPILFCFSFTTQAQTYFGQQNIISDGIETNPDVMYVSDLNGDGYMDVVIASTIGYKLVWQENIDGKGNFGVEKVISSNAGNVTSVFATDIDGDGDVDILTATGCNNEILWYENTNSEGVFGEEQLITSIAQYAFCVYAADIDSDGDMDVISASRDDDKIAWYQNDGNGNFGTQLVVSTAIEGARSVYAKDLDGDGDIDLISGAYVGNIVSWHENIDGSGNYSEPRIISNLVNRVMSVFAIDLDGDEDIDVLSASFNDDKIAWYENIDGEGNFGNQIIISSSCDGAADIYSTDLDKDGDMDVLSGSIIDDKIVWHENTNGNGYFGKEHMISSITRGPASLYASDINGDDNTDIFSAFYEEGKAVWFENLTLEIISQPQSIEICPNSNTTFLVSAKNALDYQWQVNEGNGFIHLTNNSTYSGVTTDILKITAANIMMSGFQYRCILSNPGGSINSTEATLYVNDFEMPAISSSHSNKSLDANNNCEANLPDYSIDVIANDNCDINLDIVQSPSAGTSISGLTNTVTLEVIDDANNSTSVSFNVEVLDNTVPTIISTHNNQSVFTSTNCEAILDDHTNNLAAIDNCDNDLSIVQIPLAGTNISGLTNTVTLLVTDDAKNQASVSFNIEVLDNIPPNLVCKENKIIELNNGQPLYIVKGNEFNPMLIEDNCELKSIINSFNKSETLSGAEFIVGTTKVIWTAIDIANNIAKCSQDITIISNNELNIYPNPTTGTTIINSNSSIIQEIIIYDIKGKPLLKRKTNQAVVSVDMQTQPSGIYIVKIFTNKGVFIRKIVKKK